MDGRQADRLDGGTKGTDGFEGKVGWLIGCIEQ